MNDYTKVTFTVTPNEEAVTDVLAALLAEVGFESFVPEETGMTAYAPVALFSADAVAAVVDDFPLDGFSITYTVENIEGEDWNAEWEKNYFQPIVVDDRCVIHSTFHTDVPKAQYDILIDPKMAFGTGYHQTTCHMLRAILATGMSGKSVLDMGCGTALLAILARMHGAEKVVAIDIDSTNEEVIKIARECGFSRLPVYQEDLDDIKGFLYIKDMLPYIAGMADDFNWKNHIRDAYFVPESKKINDLLEEFRQKKMHLAVVVDEYGGTDGIVTLEDILEEIDILCEHNSVDRSSFIVQALQSMFAGLAEQGIGKPKDPLPPSEPKKEN